MSTAINKHCTHKAALHEPRDGTGCLEHEYAGYIEQSNRRSLSLGNVVGVAVKNWKFQTDSGCLLSRTYARQLCIRCALCYCRYVLSIEYHAGKMQHR